jgi:O6-methylguanine-DNA--protein-cysteine methyltransferase
MSANSSLAIRIATIFDNKGLKKADKDVKGLQSAVKKLAGAAGIGLGAAAIGNFGKKAAKAFMEDQKAATQLALSVKNLGLAFETPRIEDFISKLSKASGIADDVLRPSMQKLLQTTGSVSKSQELLNQALDISRGSGVAYETVVEDLTKAYVGQTRGLNKYKLGVTAAELKTMKFADVQERLSKQFSGANEAYLDTYAGKMELLGTAAGEATEIIGKGLIDALMILSGDTSVADLAETMETLATNTSNVIVKVAELFKKLSNFATVTRGPESGFAGKVTEFIDDLTGGPHGAMKRAKGQAGRLFTGGSGGVGFNVEEERTRRKIEADAAKRAKELAALQNKTLAAQKKTLEEAKKKAALDKASKTLNLDAIGLEAALKGKISETDRISLLLQKAILEGNASLASQLSDQLNEATKRNEQLRLALLATPKAPNPYENWKIPDDVLAWTAASLGMTVSSLGTTPVPISSTFSDAQMELAAAVNAGQAAEQKLINVQVYLDGDMVGNAVRDSSINQSLSGSFNSVNRSGRFAPIAE